MSRLYRATEYTVLPTAATVGELGVYRQPLPWEVGYATRLRSERLSVAVTWTFPNEITFPAGIGFFPMIEKLHLYCQRVGTLSDAELIAAVGGGAIVQQYGATPPHASKQALVEFNVPNATGLTAGTTFSSPVKVYAVRARLGVRV